jgi:hypothetical protein
MAHTQTRSIKPASPTYAANSATDRRNTTPTDSAPAGTPNHPNPPASPTRPPRPQLPPATKLPPAKPSSLLRTSLELIQDPPPPPATLGPRRTRRHRAVKSSATSPPPHRPLRPNRRHNGIDRPSPSRPRHRRPTHTSALPSPRTQMAPTTPTHKLLTTYTPRRASRQHLEPTTPPCHDAPRNKRLAGEVTQRQRSDPNPSIYPTMLTAHRHAHPSREPSPSNGHMRWGSSTRRAW